MHNPILAKRYADALLEIAIDQNKLAELNEEIKVVRTVFTENDELVQLLDHPGISKSQKANVIETSFAAISEYVVHTIMLLVERQRTELIIPMIDVLIEAIANKQGIANLDVYTTKALSESQIENITQNFKKRLNKSTILINEKIDSSIIGGIKIRYNNTVYDGTVRNSLNKLENKIRAASN